MTFIGLFLIGASLFSASNAGSSKADALPTEYNEDYTRRVLDLAVASYLGDSSAEEAKRQQCYNKSWAEYEFQTLLVKDSPCDQDNNPCRMYLAFSTKMNSFALGFRGTIGLSQLLQESLSSLGSYVPYSPPNALNSVGMVNKYFYSALASLWPEIRNLINKQKNPQTNFVITGHSLGGAMASVAAMRLVLEENISKANVRVITFGQPRTWDYEAATAFRNNILYSWRVVHNTDPIPHAPPNYNAVKSNGKPYHHSQEIWYKSTGYDVCSITEGEDPNCSDQLKSIKFILDFLKNEHLHYMGVTVNNYGLAGCKSASTISKFFVFTTILLWLLH